MKNLDLFKDFFGSIECQEHRQKPIILGDEGDELQIATCCPKFKRQCLHLIHKIAGLMVEDLTS